MHLRLTHCHLEQKSTLCILQMNKIVSTMAARMMPTAQALLENEKHAKSSMKTSSVAALTTQLLQTTAQVALHKHFVRHLTKEDDDQMVRITSQQFACVFSFSVIDPSTNVATHGACIVWFGICALMHVCLHVAKVQQLGLHWFLANKSKSGFSVPQTFWLIDHADVHDPWNLKLSQHFSCETQMISHFQSMKWQHLQCNEKMHSKARWQSCNVTTTSDFQLFLCCIHFNHSKCNWLLHFCLVHVLCEFSPLSFEPCNEISHKFLSETFEVVATSLCLCEKHCSLVSFHTLSTSLSWC